MPKSTFSCTQTAHMNGGNIEASTKSAALYSKKDILEQYCLSNRGLTALDNGIFNNIFGCISSHYGSLCAPSKASFLTACVGRKVPSEENLYELYKRNSYDFAPFPRKPRYPWTSAPSEMYQFDEDLKSSYFQRKTPSTDPTRYTWMMPDDESVKMEKPKSIADLPHRHQVFPNCKKHVSFARSHTLSSFDEAVISLSSSLSRLNQITKSQERLLEIRKASEIRAVLSQPHTSEETIVLEKFKRGSMKTTATQTDVILNKKGGNIRFHLPSQSKTTMVSQAAQTGGVNGRKLCKSLSEVGRELPVPFNDNDNNSVAGHQVLQRTQSDEPPRSPYLLTESVMVLPATKSSSESLASLNGSKSEESVEIKNEIFIDYEPQVYPLINSTNVKDENLFADVLIKNVLIPHDFGCFGTEEVNEIDGRVDFVATLSPVDVENQSTGNMGPENPEPLEPIDGKAHMLLDQNLIDNKSNFLKLGYRNVKEAVTKEAPINKPVVPLIFLQTNDHISNHLSDARAQSWEKLNTTNQLENSHQNSLLLNRTDTFSGVQSDDLEIGNTPSSQKLIYPDTKVVQKCTEMLQETGKVSSPRRVHLKPSKKNMISTKNLHKTTNSLYANINHSQSAAVVPDIEVLAEYAKTNNDLSESTTTDDYVTATSGTDSSRKSTNIQVVPSILSSSSPERQITRQNSPIQNTLVPQIETGYSSPNEDSSSSGSYSIGGSSVDLLDRVKRRESSNKTSKSRKSNSFRSKRRENVDIANLANVKAKRKKSDKKLFSDTECLKTSNEVSQSYKNRKWSPTQALKKKHEGGKLSRKGSSYQVDMRGYKLTSDESSTGRENITNSSIVRKSKKSKEFSRRRSLSHSPKNQKHKSTCESDYQTASLPSILRKKCSKMTTSSIGKGCSRSSLNDQETCDSSTHSCKDKTTLKALSVESLRSISPGSDSVFYSDPSCYITDHQVHCLQCGKEVYFHSHLEEKHVIGENPIDIVQPPAGFEDSPKVKVGKFFKKSDCVSKSQDVRHNFPLRRSKPEIRAKSEERNGDVEKSVRRKLRPMQRSPYCSKENLKPADSSPCILPGAPDGESDEGLYVGSYVLGKWLCIEESDTHYTIPTGLDSESLRRASTSSTESEHEFLKRYHSIRQQLTHRKAYADMSKNMFSKSFECEKKIAVRRESGEFGFRIHGSKPAMVTAIETGTPAECSGLEVGDIIIAVNGINVIDKSHSEVVQIAQAQVDSLVLEIGRLSNNIQINQPSSISILYSGYLWKATATSRNALNKWSRRWFCLRSNNFLYYYKTDTETHPLGVMSLRDVEIDGTEISPIRYKSNYFILRRKNDAVSLFLSADTLEEKNNWIMKLENSIKDLRTDDKYLEEVKQNSRGCPKRIINPECTGYLVKFGTQWKSRSRRYCVLKNAALYFFYDAESSSAFGTALLHGYKIQQTQSSKKHAFEIVSRDPSKKTYYFFAESEADRKRWVTALEYSIDRWLCEF